MNKFGLIGFPLSHSFSPLYFKEKFQSKNILDCQYDLYPLEKIEDFTSLLNNNNFKGLNVTIPYKETVIPFLDSIDSTVKTIGAVNTIKIKKGKTKGFNTDVWGFEQSLKPLLESHHKTALIFGTGGAAKAIKFALEKLNIDYKFVSRKSDDDYLSYNEVNQSNLDKYKILINTTPLGMYPKIDQAPNIAYEHLDSSHLLYDLVYNPEQSKFMQLGLAQGARVKNGYEMLCLQADKSWEIWNT